MKILLDEQLPVKLRYRFNSILSVSTVRDMKWLGLKDQDLFIKIKDENFDLFVPNDQNLKFQISSQ
jgi:predicted nuclease of predicted toxin-antitoxin system